MVRFQEFCKRITAGSKDLSGVSTECAEMPEQYKEPVEVLVSMMKTKKKIFDKINVPFIESVFEDEEENKKILSEKIGDNDIPDAIFIRLSNGIFGENPSALNVDQQAIIKVLTIYICIQN